MKVRTQFADGNKWYCLNDTATMLDVNTRWLVRKFALNHQVKRLPLIDTLGRTVKMVFVVECVYHELIRVYG